MSTPAESTAADSERNAVTRAPNTDAGSHAGSNQTAGARRGDVDAQADAVDRRRDAGVQRLPAVEQQCMQEGRMRCMPESERGVEECRDGMWHPSEPCAEGEVCSMGRQLAPTCIAVAEICKGSAGAWVCDDSGVMYACTDQGEIDAMTACKTPRHCQEGLRRGACAECLTGGEDEYICDGAELQRCSGAGDGYVRVMTCPSEGLCNPVVGDCTDAICRVGQKKCLSDVLSQCRGDRTGFDDIEACEPGLCDPEASECDVCVPGFADCRNRSTAHVCNDEGTRLESRDCPAATPICTGAGICVECGDVDDCGPGERCEASRCVCPGNPAFDSDDSNCGSCGSACLRGEECVAGECEPACDGACGAGEICVEGDCRCPGLAGSYETDTNNCGRCGQRCARGKECVAGVCAARPLLEGALAVSSSHACAIRFPDGSIKCWGDREVTAMTPRGTGYAKVSAASRYTCALADAGSITCWGVGNADLQVPVPSSDQDFTDVAAGGSHACGLHKDGSVTCWPGFSEDVAVYVDKGQTLPSSNGPFRALCAGADHTCALLRSSSRVECWGSDTQLQASPPGFRSFNSLACGPEVTCGLTSTGTVQCWGHVFGTATLDDSPVTGSFASLSIAHNFVHAGTTGAAVGVDGGEIEVWGELGRPPAGAFGTVSVGVESACALLPNGKVVCWGSDAQSAIVRDAPSQETFGLQR